MNPKIEKSTFQFLTDLNKNNNRDWFTENKSIYDKAHQNLVSFTDELLAEMRKHDHIETASGKKALMRIYRDTRFSKDKTPYKNHFGGGFRRATAHLRGGYYFQIGPGTSRVAGGFWAPNNEDLLRIRQDIDMNFEDWQKVLSDKKTMTFGDLKGERLKTAPKGFSMDNAGIKLIQLKQFYFEKEFTDEEVLQPNFLTKVNETFLNLRPFFDHMSEVLTTNSNGESIV